MYLRCQILLLAVGWILSINLISSADETTAGLELFESKIRPVLVKHCYQCHSADAQAQKKLKGGLLLDTKQGTLAGGDSGPAVVPGDVEESLLISALAHEDFEMPPAGKLPQQVIDDFSRWVKLGAPDPREGKSTTARQEIDFAKAGEFWSFKPPQKSPPPPVQDSSWTKTDIDRFILARLEQAGLQPVDVANKRQLLRRATFDLIGLPPTPQEIQDFLDDTSEEAFSNVVERLLKSPHHGERWGRHWLDVARYAEDQAHTFGTSRRTHAHQYRDWVINAINDDIPYDQFVKLQLAGDLILDEDAPQHRRLAGLGILGLGAVYYKNSDKEKAIADELDDRIDTVTRGFLGLTVSCARCHDHKYDPIPTEDYYSLAGVFHNTRMLEKPLANKEEYEKFKQAEQLVREQEKEVRDYRKQCKIELAEKQREQVVEYMTAVWIYRQRKANDARYDVNKLVEELKLQRGWFDRWNRYLDINNKNLQKVASLDTWRELPQPDGKSDQPSAELKVAASNFQEDLNYCLDLRDGKVVARTQAGGKALFTSKRVDSKTPLVDIRVDLQGSRTLYLVMTDSGNGDNSDWGDWLAPKLVGPRGEKSLLDLDWKSATATHHSVRKNRNCAGQPLRVNNKNYELGIGTHALSIIEYELPEGFTHFVAQGGLDGSGIGSVEFRVYNALPTDLKKVDDSPERKARAELLRTVFSDNGLFGTNDNELQKMLSQSQADNVERLLAAVETAKQQMPPKPPMAHVVQDSGSRNLPVYLRGNPARKGDEAPRRFLRILAGDERPAYQQGSGRLELANDIASDKNPLTARVMVNRVWQHHFGRGLVGSASNFGATGDRPTHPQLLDWLTVRFIESGWSLKWLHREIMLSRVYQLSSEQHPTAMQKDPQNRFLWRANRRRLEVESWRDALLAVSGSLDKTMGGPTVKLSDNNNRRRTVYGAVSRHELDGLLRLFDFPDANVTNAGRTETTVPQQQLFVLNSDFFINQAKLLETRLQKEAGDDTNSRIQLAYQLLFGRQPDAEELALGNAFVTREKAPQDKLTPWVQYTQALLGSNEFIYID